MEEIKANTWSFLESEKSFYCFPMYIDCHLRSKFSEILNVSSQKFGLRFKQLAEFLKPHVETRSSVGYFKCSRVIFFDLSFLSQTSRIHRTTREVGGNFLNSSIPLLTSSKTLAGKLLQIAHLCT